MRFDQSMQAKLLPHARVTVLAIAAIAIGCAKGGHAASGGTACTGSSSGQPATSTASAYEGCYVDTAQHALSTQLMSSGATIETCIEAAQTKGFAYAGVQNRGECYGGNTLAYAKVADTECNTPCSANCSEMCGGVSRNSIYATGNSPTGTTPTPNPSDFPPPTGPVTTVSTGGHAGTTTDPYPGANIQAALQTVQAGGVVFIPAGNWSLAGVTGGQINVTTSNITVQGAGSGNTFDQYGHPTYSASPTGNYTRLFTNNDSNRFVVGNGASQVTVRDIFFDGGTQGAGGGSYNAFLLVINAGSGNSFYNVRATQSAQAGEACVSTFHTPGTAWYSSLFIAPPYHGALLQTNSSGPTILKNCTFYNNNWNPIYESDDVMDGCTETLGPGSHSVASVGITGGGTPAENGQILNSYFDGTGDDPWGPSVSGFSIGAGLNDPGNPGTVTNLVIRGTWLIGETVAIASDIWAIYGDAGKTLGGSAGMTVNGFTVDHNTILGTKLARIDFRGTPSGDNPRGTSNSHEANYLSGGAANHNYLSSPNNQYLTDSFTSSATATYNVGLDVNATSDTTPPTVGTFALGTPVGNMVPVTMAGTAAYGALMYLINESGSSPSAEDAAWTYTPPVSWTLSSSTVTTLYGWAKSAAGNISARVSATVPR